jgi:hypothetical protein
LPALRIASTTASGWSKSAYIATSFVGLMLPQYVDVVEKVTFPVLFGELALVLWLLIIGMKERAVAAPAS